MNASDAFRWPDFSRRCIDPLFFLNRRRRLITVNPAFEHLTGLPVAELRGLTCVKRATGHALEPLGRTIGPPADVWAGRAVTCRRAAPGAVAGPPWWDIDFLPMHGPDELIGVLGRVRIVGTASAPMIKVVPSAWAELRESAMRRTDRALAESNVPAMRRAVAQAELAARAGTTVAIIGEAGTGRRTLARAVHNLGPRREWPCISVDAGRLPIDAVTDVIRGPFGLRSPSAAGTLILAQPHLLPREVQAEIADRIDESGVPLISIFDAEPEQLHQRELLHPGLLAKTTLLSIHLPPLRERIDDLPNLVESFLQQISQTVGKPKPAVTEDAMNCIRAYAWPRNFDELDETLTAAVRDAAGDVVTPEHLPRDLRMTLEPSAAPASKSLPLDELLELIEARAIRVALERAKGNKSKAAELLGIWRPRLLRRMEALKIADSGEG